MSATQEILELERAFWGAAGDGGFYQEHFADEGRCVFAMGTLDKAAAIEAVEGAPPWTDVQLADVEEVPLGSDARVLLYLATGWRQGADVPYRARVSSVYVRRDGAWQLAVHQQTPVS